MLTDRDKIKSWNRRCSQIETKSKVEIEDGHEASSKPYSCKNWLCSIYVCFHNFILIVVPTIYGIHSRFMLVCVFQSTKRQNGNIFFRGGGLKWPLQMVVYVWPEFTSFPYFLIIKMNLKSPLDQENLKILFWSYCVLYRAWSLQVKFHYRRDIRVKLALYINAWCYKFNWFPDLLKKKLFFNLIWLLISLVYLEITIAWRQV